MLFQMIGLTVRSLPAVLGPVRQWTQIERQTKRTITVFILHSVQTTTSNSHYRASGLKEAMTRAPFHRAQPPIPCRTPASLRRRILRLQAGLLLQGQAVGLARSTCSICRQRSTPRTDLLQQENTRDAPLNPPGNFKLKLLTHSSTNWYTKLVQEA